MRITITWVLVALASCGTSSAPSPGSSAPSPSAEPAAEAARPPEVRDVPAPEPAEGPMADPPPVEPPAVQ